MNKSPDVKKVESLVAELIKELDIEINDTCQGIALWIHDKEKLVIESSSIGSTSIENNFKGKYIGSQEADNMESESCCEAPQSKVFKPCSICGENILEGDSYYEVGAQDVCEQCINTFRRIAERDE